MYPSPLVPRKFNHRSLENLSQISSPLQKYQSNEEKYIPPLPPLKNKTPRKLQRLPRKHATNSLGVNFSNRDRLPSRQSSCETLSVKRVTPLLNSYSVSALYDRIHKERKAHTMAPLARISGPIDMQKSKLFASITSPDDTQAIKTSSLTQKSISKLKLDAETSDDNSTVIVKVVYDPTEGAPPSEDSIRQAINSRLILQPKRTKKKDPIIVNILEKNIQSKFLNRPPQPAFNRPLLSFQQRPTVQPSTSSSQLRNLFTSSITSRPSFPLPPLPPIHRASRLPTQNENTHLTQAIKPLINRQEFQSKRLSRLPDQEIRPLRANRSHSTGVDTCKSTNPRMASQQPTSTTTTISTQQTSSRALQVGSSSNEIYRPSAISDVPELSKENLLNMLNQIPDLQGCQFNIEYASPSAAEEYPIPLSFVGGSNSFPDPVIVDQLPNNIIQHVKRGNNPALTAALEATIRREQPSISALNVQTPTVMHYAAQPHEQVQQSRPTSSNDSDSGSTDLTSSESSSSSSSSSSSEESDSEELENLPSSRIMNTMPFVGPTPPTSYSDKYYR